MGSRATGVAGEGAPVGLVVRGHSRGSTVSYQYLNATKSSFR